MLLYGDRKNINVLLLKDTNKCYCLHGISLEYYELYNSAFCSNKKSKIHIN